MCLLDPFWHNRESFSACPRATFMILKTNRPVVHMVHTVRSPFPQQGERCRQESCTLPHAAEAAPVCSLAGGSGQHRLVSAVLWRVAAEQQVCPHGRPLRRHLRQRGHRGHSGETRDGYRLGQRSATLRTAGGRLPDSEPITHGRVPCHGEVPENPLPVVV